MTFPNFLPWCVRKFSVFHREKKYFAREMEKQILTLSTRMTACCSLAHNHGHVYASIGIFFLFNIIVIDF